jgi:integrase
VSDLDRQDVLSLIRSLQRDGRAAWTIRGTTAPLGLFIQWAVDQNWRTGNPVRELRRGERPKTGRKPHRNLTADDLWSLVNAASEDRKAFVALLCFAGLRLGEDLGLTWRDVDMKSQILHVRFQLDRDTLTRVEPKTERSVREIEIDDGLLSILRHWKARSRLSQPHHFVTTTRPGRPLEHRQAARRLASVVKRAGLDIDGLPKITPHQLRYSFGSVLIDAGEATSRVSRLMGHANEAITGQVYAHEIERRHNSERTRARMRAAFGTGEAAAR